jgi:broad specificity phosphatase PhoE
MLPSPAPDSCVLVVVRHGATSANLAVPHVLQGCGLDLSLCDVGVRQAEQVAEFLGTQFAGEPSPALFSSKLKRAVETAERIAAKVGGGSIEPIAALHEVDTGRWEGRDWGDVTTNDVEAHRQFMEFPDTVGYPGGENITQVANRVQPVFESLAERHLGRRIVIVAHNILLRAYLARLLGIPLRNYRCLTQDNCCVNVLVWQAGTMTVRMMNSVWHIGK